MTPSDELWVPRIFSEQMVLQRQTPDGKAVLVTGEAGQSHTGVRYAWRGFPEVTLYNSAGLPATPFMYPRPELKIQK